jgi:hypothetical protein
VQKKIFEHPIDLEVLLTANANSATDMNRAKLAMIVDASPVNLLISKNRIDSMVHLIPTVPTFIAPKKVKAKPLSPRLDVLSHYLFYSLEVSFERLRISLVNSSETSEKHASAGRETLLRSSLKDFLDVVSTFDLNFPHEEALASAMQICIDRLIGCGVSLEDSWEVTNTGLLHFLEDMTLVEAAAEGSVNQVFVVDEARHADNVSRKVESSVNRTADNLMHFLLKNDEAGESFLHYDFVIDIPQGMQVSLLSLFYDKYANIRVPAMFLSDEYGIHLVRMISSERSQSMVDSVVTGKLSASSKSSESLNAQLKNVHPVSNSIVFQTFVLDEQHPFGKGGYSLSVLGSDFEALVESETRTREMLNDVQFGEVEFLISPMMCGNLLTSLSMLLEPVSHTTKRKDTAEASNAVVVENNTVSASLVATGISTSVLLASNRLTPFSRLTTTGQVFATTRRNVNSAIEAGSSFAARTMSLCNLTRGGELYPDIVISLRDHSEHAIIAKVSGVGRQKRMELVLRDIQIVFLQQYISECNQYFNSEKYGLVPYLKYLKRANLEKEARVHSKWEVAVSLLDVSFITPRSSNSSDMVAFEAKRVSLESTKPPTFSFVMPTESTPLRTFHGRYDKSASVPNHTKASADTTTSTIALLSRIILEIKGLRAYTCMSETGAVVKTTDNAAFRFFYVIDGRSEPHKPVYTRREAGEGIAEGHDSALEHDERQKRMWKEITVVPVDLNIIYDKTPQLRLLVTEPDEARENRLELNVRLSQFCLLLSIWFSNMQELPAEFPFSPTHLYTVAKLYFPKSDIPEFGTKEFQHFLAKRPPFRSETGVKLRRMALRCTFDRDYFDDAKLFVDSTALGMRLELQNAVIHVASDWECVTRVGLGCSSAVFVNESKTFERVLSFGNNDSGAPVSSWGDLQFGVYDDYRLLKKGLPQRFQMSVFMTPGWTLYNLGMDAGDSNIADFTSIFQILEFFSSYFSLAEYGNPAFEAIEQVVGLKHELTAKIGDEKVEYDLPGNNIDFRLWLVDPILSIPCDPLVAKCPGVRVECDSFWYQYSSLKTYTTQEVVSKGLNVYFDDRCRIAGAPRKGSTNARQLIQGLSLGLRLNYNYITDHSSYSMKVPFEDDRACSLVSRPMCVAPVEIPREFICEPYEQPPRFLGVSICEITLSVEVLPLVSASILNLFTGHKDDFTEDEDLSSEGVMSVSDGPLSESTYSDGKSKDESESSIRSSDKAPESSFSLTAEIGDIRVFAFDPVLGPHLPVGVLSIASVSITASQFSGFVPSGISHSKEYSNPGDLQVVILTLLWADYFKLGQTRSWEPLLCPYKFRVLYEKSTVRGSGLLFSSDVPLHFNVSGALLVIMDEVIDSFRRLLTESYSGKDSVVNSDSRLIGANLVTETKEIVEEQIGSMHIIQERPSGLSDEDRVAFSIRNMTGQKVRVRKPATGKKTAMSSLVSYVKHGQSTQLSFHPSISMIQNMHVVDVDFPGLPSYPVKLQDQHSSTGHSVDLQVPGFCWLQGVKVDSFGRMFADITPRSSDLILKATKDWRLSNVLKVLFEVGLQNGGRQVTVRSLFSLVNRTSHNISLVLNPDPTYTPYKNHTQTVQEDDIIQSDAMQIDSCVEPGAVYQIPTLLIENALRQPGSHIGSLWLSPSINESPDTMSFEPFLREGSGSTEGMSIAYSSRPIQLAKIVSETAYLFEASNAQEISNENARSGLQISCPVTMGSDRLSPFCYAVEISRSPIVKSRARDAKDMQLGETMHGPVSYSLAIHPTYVVVNLLPERGRFELMHAVRRTVVWFADLDPGEQVSVHSVGLDAPLLLLINLGFSKTPVGEGALVHHGLDQPRVGVRGTFSRKKCLEPMIAQLTFFLSSRRWNCWVETDRKSR